MAELQQAPGFGKQAGNGKRMSTGVIFFKTKLCSRFKAGTCPYYAANCNFAHGLEDLRKPPPGWEEYVNPQPQDGSQKPKPCKSFFAEGICPYAERCIFSHEDPALKPTPVQVPPAGATASKPSNWKTRLCNKFETTGYCPFGEKCHFAHGATELQQNSGSETPLPEKKPQSLFTTDASISPITVDATSSGATNSGAALREPKAGSIKTVWRGPTTGISTVYGDWIEEDSDEDDQQEV